MLQTVDVLESDLQVVVDKALDVGGTDALFPPSSWPSRAPKRATNMRNAQDGFAPSQTTPHLYLRGAEHVVDLLRSQAVQEEMHACGGRPVQRWGRSGRQVGGMYTCSLDRYTSM